MINANDGLIEYQNGTNKLKAAYANLVNRGGGGGGGGRVRRVTSDRMTMFEFFRMIFA